MSMKSDTNIIEFLKIKTVVGQKEIDYKFKKMDKVWSILLTDDKYFSSYDNVRHLTIATGGDHGKGSFTVFLTMHIEMRDVTKRHMDEVIGKIENNQDNVENLRPLGLKLRRIFLNYNVSFCGNILVCVGIHGTTLKRKAFLVTYRRWT